MYHGLQAYEDGNYELAFSRFHAAAEAGDAVAQALTGILLENGEGAPKNATAALHWYEASAARGEPAGHLCLGLAYAYGKGVAQDHQRAIPHMRIAADAGYSYAQAELGYAYDRGLGVPVDHATAAEWFRLAAMQGNVTAQGNLGGAYLVGRGVPQDLRTAMMWSLAAAEQNEARSQTVVAILYLGHNDVVEHDAGEAVKWLNLAIRSGYEPASTTLSLLIREGHLTDADIVEGSKRSMAWTPARPITMTGDRSPGLQAVTASVIELARLVLLVGAVGVAATQPVLGMSPGAVYVHGHYRRDGTYVRPHWRTAPDGYVWNNYGRPGPGQSYDTPGYVRDADGDGIPNVYDIDDDGDGVFDDIETADW